ncbi:MAG TPA: hypothetical protein VF691_13185 [Cytophagaceae bacterium]|jgi:hypothetical protein
MKKTRLNLLKSACVFLAFSITSCDQKSSKENAGDTKAENNINTYSSISLDNQNGQGSSYFDVEKNVTYSDSTADANLASIDIIAYDDSVQGPILAAPSDSLLNIRRPNISGWTAKNKTYFKFTKVTPEQFDTISSEATLLKEAGVASDAPLETKIQIDANKVVAFQIDQSGKYGLAKIVSVSGSTSNPGKIAMEVKMQK